MVQSINPYLNFNGDCEEALQFYQKALGANVHALMRWGDMPDADLPPEAASKVMYARLEVGGGAIELSDAPPGMTMEFGSAHMINIHIDEPDDVDRFYAALVEGGQSFMAPQNTFWGARYAHCADRYGVQWSFHCQVEPMGE